MRKFLTILFMTLLAYAAGYDVGWADTSTVTASKVTSSSATWTGTANVSWSVSVDGGATNQNVTNDYAQVGTKKSPSTSITFSTSGISGTITSIVVDCASYSGLATLSATVGGNSFGDQNQVTPSWSNENTGGEITFTGSASGAIVITMTNGNGGRAMYIKSITVTYTSSGGDDPQPTLEVDPTSLSFNATVNNNAQQTVALSGENLTGNVTLTISGDNNAMFTVTPTSITPSNGEVLQDVSITYTPTAAGTHTATLTISSAGAQSVTVALSGTATGPTLEVDPTSLSFEALVNNNEAKTVDVYGYHLTGNMSLAISGDNASMFTVSDDSFTPDAGGDVSETVTITYAPTAVGTHTATLTISSAGAQNVTVALSGSGVILTDAPVMADAAAVTSTSFKAVWTDKTAAAYVRDYTLYVNKVEETPEPSTQTVDDVINQSVTGVTGSSYTDWTAICGSGAEYAGICAGSNESVQLRTKNSNEGVVTTTSPGTVKKVVVSWESHTTEGRTLNVYGKNSAYSAASDLFDTSKQGTLLGTIVYGTSTELTIEGNYAYVGVRSASDPMYLTDITFTWEVPASSSGAPRLKAVVEDGDANNGGLVVTGITAKEYTVNGLTSGETYEFYVKANYIDNSYKQSHKKEVTLPDNAPRLAVNPASLTFDEQYTGVSTQKTFSVSGANLSGNVTLSVSGDYFTVEPTTLTPTAGTLAATTVTVTYAPTVAGTHNATITISSAGAEAVTVSLTGSAILLKEVPVMTPADTETEVGDTWFDATWTDATPVANVSSYTLYVNKVEETPEPIETTIYEKVTDATTLAAGDKLIFVDETDKKAGGAIDANKNGSWLTAVDVTINNNKIDIENVAVNVLTLEGEADNWTFKTSDGNYLTCTAAKFVKLGNTGTATSIAISDGDATISFGSTAGRILYNATSPRFTTYTSDLSASMRLPQIYRVTYTTSSGAPRLRATETGDASTRTITGISGDTKTYRVSGLTPGAKYDYKVKAVYVDQTESELSNKERVTLKLTINEKTLAEIVASGEEDKIYTITNQLVGVYADDNNNTLWAKDEATSIDANAIHDGYTDFLKQAFTEEAVGDLWDYAHITVPTNYSQNNWIALVMPEGYDAADYVDAYIPASTVTGVLTNDVNYELTLSAAPTVGEAVTYTKNVYTPANFVNTYWGENDSEIYFVKPKVQEVANIVWAVWDGNDSFVMPNKIPGEAKAASFKPDFSLNGGTPELEKGKAYAFEAVIENAGTTSSGARRLKNAGSPTAFTVKPLNLTGSSPVTGISNVGGSVKEVKSVRVYNVAGVEQRELQTGVNIVVTTYTDGTRTTAKILK